MSERLTAVGAVRRVSPPWLRRTHGARVMEGVADILEQLTERFIQGVKVRFPGAPPRPVDLAALALTGRGRRIRRGPNEAAETYARRLRGWWDAHRTRGGPYALLEQLRAFFLDWPSARMDVVYAAGTRRWMDEDGAITRDAIVWDADGSGEWAHVWVFFHLPDAIVVAVDELTTQGGDTLVTQDEEPLMVTETISPADLSENYEEIFRAIPREWTTAHVPYVTVVLLFSTARLWNYPQPVPTWAAWGASGATWGGPVPVVLIAE